MVACSTEETIGGQSDGAGWFVHCFPKPDYLLGLHVVRSAQKTSDAAGCAISWAWQLPRRWCKDVSYLFLCSARLAHPETTNKTQRTQIMIGRKLFEAATCCLKRWLRQRSIVED